MKTSVVARPPVPFATEHLKRREGAYRFFLQVDDTDYEHTHTEGGHAFPCTKVQLRFLARQINRALGAVR